MARNVVEPCTVYENPALELDEADTPVHPKNGIYTTQSSSTTPTYQETKETSTVIRRDHGRKQSPSTIGQFDKHGGPVELLSITELRNVQTTHHYEDEKNLQEALKDFVSKKQGNDLKQYKSKKVRSFYKKQDRLIAAFEDYSRKDAFDGAGEATDNRKLASLFSKITFVVNLMLLSVKLVASILSSSMSILSSLVDSAVDLLSGIIMWWASRAMKKRDPHDYPQGRSKLEPVSIVILSVVMSLASVQLMRESGEKIASLVTDPTALPSMELPTFIIAGSTVVVKLVLWVVCRRVDSPMVQALALDHRNDVMSNSVAIVCGYLGSRNFQASTQLGGFIYVDPVGAIIISCYIIYNWWRTGSEQIRLLTGHTASQDFLSHLTWIAMNHDPRITHIDTLRAYHYGNNFLVKVDIVLPESMRLREAHDIGESLQQKLESIPEVERAFVHVDYEFRHKPSSEHKII